MSEATAEAPDLSNLPALLDQPGSRPLGARRERYCWLRAAQQPRALAYRSAVKDEEYDYHAARGNGARWERRRDVAERIAYLCRQDEEVLALKRQRLEEQLWMIHDCNVADMWTMVEVPAYDRQGKPILDADGNPTTKLVQRPKPIADMPEEVQRAIEVVTINEAGFVVPKPYSKLQANAELRKFLGVGAAGALPDDGLGRVPTGELIASLAKEARELGIEINLSYRFGEQP